MLFCTAYTVLYTAHIFYIYIPSCIYLGINIYMQYLYTMSFLFAYYSSLTICSARGSKRRNALDTDLKRAGYRLAAGIFRLL